MNFACRDHLPSIAHSGSPQPNPPLCPAPAPPSPRLPSNASTPVGPHTGREGKASGQRGEEGRWPGGSWHRGLLPVGLSSSSCCCQRESGQRTKSRYRQGWERHRLPTLPPRRVLQGDGAKGDAPVEPATQSSPSAPAPTSPPTADGQTQRAGPCTAAHRAYPTASPCTTAARRGEGGWGERQPGAALGSGAHLSVEPLRTYSTPGALTAKGTLPHSAAVDRRAPSQTTQRFVLNLLRPQAGCLLGVCMPASPAWEIRNWEFPHQRSSTAPVAGSKHRAGPAPSRQAPSQQQPSPLLQLGPPQLSVRQPGESSAMHPSQLRAGSQRHDEWSPLPWHKHGAPG